MTLREVTRTVISLVENVSGCPVVVSEDASLKTLAALPRRVGGKAPFFFIDRSRASILSLSRFDSIAVRFQTGG